MPRPKGYKVKEETKLKISKSHIGLKATEETKKKQSLAKIGKPGTMKGKHHTYEAKMKNRLAHIGEKSAQWQGGRSALVKLIRRSLQYRTWRTRIFERDNYTCIWCGANKKYLNVDHIKQFALILKQNNITNMEEAIQCNELWNTNNGRTLCIDCHKETDTYLNKGKKNI